MKRVEVDKDLCCEIGLLAHKYVDGGAEYKLTLINTEANVLQNRGRGRGRGRWMDGWMDGRYSIQCVV